MSGRDWWQNRVAESRLVLPCCIAVCTLAWWLTEQSVDVSAIISWALCLCTAAVLLETNIGLQIQRTRTRLAESIWLLMAAVMPEAHANWKTMACALCLASGLGIMMCCYQKREPVTLVFHSFLMIGIGSIFSPTMFLVAVLAYVCLATLMRAFTWRVLWAGITGLLTPYWCWFLAELCFGDANRMIEYVVWQWMLSYPHWPPYADSSIPTAATWILLTLFCIIGIIHYMSKRYEDKIRVRMLLYVFVLLCVILQAAFVFLPGQRVMLLAMMSVSASPLMAHYWSLTSGRVALILMLTSIVIWGAVMAICLMFR